MGADSSGDGWRLVRTLDNGFNLFAPSDEENGSPRPRRRPVPPADPAVSPAEARALFERHRCKRMGELYLADQLGIHVAGVHRLGCALVGADDEHDGYWLLPERDEHGVIVGLQRREYGGRKRQVRGTRGGLSFALAPGDGEPLLNLALVVEGYSDAAAGESLGLWTVGRPSNMGGAALLAPLLQHAARRHGVGLLVVGENDQKPDGRWPGKEGADATAQRLAEALGVPVRVAYPPPGHKDLRAWVRALVPEPRKATREELLRLGRVVGEALLASAGVVLAGAGTLPPPADPPPGAGPESGAVAEVIEAGRSTQPCPRHRTPFLRHRGDASRCRVVLAACKSWSCPVCGCRRRSEWMLRLLRLTAGTAELYVSAPHPAHARKARRRLDDGAYVLVSTTGGGTLLVAARPGGALGEEKLGRAAACDRIARALLDADPAARRPVSTGGAWRAEREAGGGQYRRLGQGRQGAFGVIVGRLRKRGLGPRVHGTRGTKADWGLSGDPGDWPDERLEELLEQLRAPQAEGEEGDVFDEEVYGGEQDDDPAWNGGQ
jgi:hypothetical protein